MGLVRGHLERIPEDERPASLTDIFRQLGTRAFPQWPAAAPRLCRTDANISNFIRRPEGWYSVDWENSGWGDPAFEVADLMSHPAYITVPCERWPWVARTYCRIAGDRAMLYPTYYGILLCLGGGWPATHEAPRADPRLVELAADWEEDRLSSTATTGAWLSSGWGLTEELYRGTNAH